DVRHASFHNDIDKLVRSLKVQLAEADAEQRRRDEDERRRQEAEAKQREDEEERRRTDERSRQQAENRRRLDEAKAKERRRDEELRRPEEETKLAAKEAGRQTQPEHEPKQPVKPWLLPLIGAGAASLPMLPIAVASEPSDFASLYPFIVVEMIHALYG